jgi:gliding motility-associated-like protein
MIYTTTNFSIMKQLKTVLTFLLLFIVSASFSQGLNCNTATPYCDAPGGASVTFPNNTNNSSESGPNYGCLTTHPNPAWFYFKTTTAGNYIFDLGQGTTCGGTNLDVDFICWGPFTNPTTACNNLTAGNTVDCSYSASATEVIDVIGAPAGQYYIVLITNYSNAAGCISFGLQGSSPPTDCSITCASVLSGPGIVSFPSNNPLNGVPATPMPASVACNSGIQNMYATNITPFGNPITPGVMVSFLNNANTSNSVSWYENSALVGCFGPSASCQNLTASYSEQLQFSYMSPSATNQFSFCENNTAQPNITNTNVKDLSGGANMPGAPFTWVDDGGCQTITIPPGTVRGITTWGSTCGACLTNVTDWGAAQFNPAAASIGTHTITYTFDSQQPGCTPYTTSITITVTNPYNAAFTAPGPFCAGAACASFTPTNSYTVGTGSYSGTGVSGNSFCPATAGVGTFPITYTVGVSPTCRASQTNNIVVNANPTANAGSPASLTCLSTNTLLSGSGGGTYSWTGPAGGISAGANSATPTVSLAGTYTLLVANGTCTNSATVAVTQNTATPSVTPASSGVLNCLVTSVNASATTTTTPVNYNWSGPGIISGTGTGTISVNLPGTYNYTVSSNGCNTIGSQVITQNILSPFVNASVNSILNCTVSSVNASATTTTSPVTYNWSGPGITSGNGTGTISVNQPGSYNYTVTATNGCSVTGSQAVIQNTVAPSVAAAVSGSLNCSINSVNASATTTTTPVTYNWSGTGITSGAGTGTVAVNQPGTYNYTVTASNGCSVTGSQTVIQNTVTPSVSAAISGSLNCLINSVNASVTTTTSPVTYNWSGPGIISGTGTGTISVNQPGSYNYTVTAINGCSVTGSQAVIQNTVAPSVSAAVSGSLNCTVSSVNASATTTTTPVTYNWTGTGITSGAGTGTIAVNQPGSYNYTVTATNGCSVTGSQAVIQNTTVPSVSAGLTQTLVCGVPSVTLAGSGSIGSNATWLGGVCGVVTNFTTTACAPGTYTLIATDAISTCTNSSIVSVSSSTNVPQATVNAITNSITCTNSLVAIGVTLTNPDPVSYSWSGPGVSGTTSTAITSASLAGTYSVVITNTLSNCQSIFNVVVPDDLNPVSASVLPSASLTCLTSSVTLSASPTGTNYAYSWSGPGTITNGTTDNATVDAGGNYIVTITNNINGCSGSFTVNVPTNTITPTFTLGTASSVTTTCASPNATLSATSSSDPNTIYTWTTPSSTTISGSPIFVSTSGVYTVVITNTISGCSTSSASSQSTVEVIADSGIPVVTLAANSLSITCSNPTPSVAVTTTASPVIYNWTPTVGIVPGTETTANPVFNAAGSYSIVVTNTLSGCASSINSNVVTVVLDNNSPVIALSSAANDGTITCTNTQVTITPTITSSGTGNLTYTWLPSGVTSSSINDATFTSAGIYTITVTNTLTGCVTTSTNSANTFTVYQNTVPPIANITAISTNSTIGCGGNSSTVTLSSTTSSTNTTVTWLPGSQTTPTLDVTSAGIYTLVVVDAVNGCSVSTQYTVSGSSTPPQNVDAGSNVSIPCGSLSTQLNGTTTSTDVVTYDWSGPSASSITSATNIPNPTVTESGIYTLTVTNPSNGCTATATVNVVQSTVTASITANPTEGISPLTVNFDGSASTGATNYSWTFGDGNVSGVVNPSNIFTQAGSYTVTLIASASPCSDTATIVIVVNAGLTLEIPNVFTPNNDGSNDIFTIKSTGVKEISLQIFNRWGQKLYEFSGPKASWDGKVPSGEGAPEGTYFYFVKATGFDDKEIERNGTVSLFR